ncbi:helix-turn-helix domain-containing protein [Streptomyces sp. NPDC059766]|uniref:helix-turn-helix domain-containing protein n=1 Tax=Streptomyces sp. NPDC059766 TaxID=3346940 RepID=UPI0036587DE3
MRYANGGDLTAERRAAREGIRLEAGQRFARGDRTSDITKDLRVSERSVEQWLTSSSVAGDGRDGAVSERGRRSC